MSLKVLHLSPTPLVAAPGKLSRALRQAGHDSLCVALNDYPKNGPLHGKFIDDVTLLAEAGSEVKDLVDGFARAADVIHIHNDLPASTVQWLRELSPRARFVYQVHSPLREGPLYFERAPALGLPISRHLVVGQYQPRHYPDYLAVPNLVLDEPFLAPRRDDEPLRVLFSPTHSRTGRWNAKYSERLEKVLRTLHDLKRVEIVWPTAPLSPSTLMALRRTCHVSIDEIMTGAFHQVSIEGLCAGNVVINRADFFSKSMMACCARAPELPPFVHADESSIEDVLIALALSPRRTAELQAASFRYFDAHLRADRLVNRFVHIYETLH